MKSTIDTIREHSNENKALLGAVARVAFHCLAMTASVFGSNHWFGGNFISALSLFMVFSLVFELVVSAGRERICGRYLAYLCCLVALGVSGCILVREGSSHCHGCQPAAFVSK